MEDQLLTTLAVIFFVLYWTVFCFKIYNIFTKGNAYSGATFGVLTFLYLFSFGMTLFITLMQPNYTMSVLLNTESYTLALGVILTLIEWAWVKTYFHDLFNISPNKDVRETGER